MTAAASALDPLSRALGAARRGRLPAAAAAAAAAHRSRWPIAIAALRRRAAAPGASRCRRWLRAGADAGAGRRGAGVDGLHASAATPAARCWPRCWRSSRPRPPRCAMRAACSASRLFAPFATFLLDQGPLSLALGLVAAVLALVALQRLADLESGDARFAHAAWRARCAASASWSLIGLPLALAAFWLFPRLASPLWGVPERALGASGPVRHDDAGRMGRHADRRHAGRCACASSARRRRSEQMYWRGPVLWDFDGQHLDASRAGARTSRRRRSRPRRRAGTTSWRWSPPTASNWSRSTCRCRRPRHARSASTTG